MSSTNDVYILSGVVALAAAAVVLLCVSRCYRGRSGSSKQDGALWYVQGPDGKYGATKKSKGKKDKKKKKKKKKKKDRPQLTTDDDLSFDGNGGADRDLEGGGGGGRGDGGGMVNLPGQKSSGSVGEFEREVSDQALLTSFLSVLNEGLSITLHGNEGRPKMVKLWLEDYDLKWAPKNSIIKKKRKLNLSEILFVEKGKQTTNFARASARAASEELCFSLVTETSTLDFESSSKMEREAMCQGFTLILDDLRAAKNINI